MSEPTGTLASEQPSSPTVETPLAYKVVRGGIWVAASSYFNLGFGFLANVVLARLLVPEYFGVFALAQFFGSFINLRPKIGIGQAFAQRQETSGELAGSHLTLDVTAGTLTVLVTAVAVPVLHALGYSWNVVWVMLALAALGVLDALTATAWVLLDKGLHLATTSLVSSAAFALSYMPALWMAWHGGRYWSLVAQTGTYSLLLLLGMWWAAYRQLPYMWQLRWRFDRRVAMDLVRFGVPVGLAAMGALLVGQFDNFLVGTFVGARTLGLYVRAYALAQWPSQLVTAVISRAAFYTYARLQDDRVRLQKMVTMTLWLITTLALPLALGIFAAAPDLVALLYGPRWLPSVVFVRFLAMYSVLSPLLGDASSLFVAVGRPRLTAVVAAVEAATLVAIGTPLTLRFGAVGTCIAVGITFLVGLGLTYRYVVHVIALYIRTTLGWPALATVLTLSGYLVLIRCVDMNHWPLIVRVLCKLAYAGSAYFAIMFALQPRVMAERVVYVWRLARSRRT